MKTEKNAVMTGVQNRGPHWYIYNVAPWTPTNWQPVPDGKSGELETPPLKPGHGNWPARGEEIVCRKRQFAERDSLKFDV